MLRSTLVLAVSACLFLCGPVRAEPRPASSADFQRASATVEALAAAAQTAPGASPALSVVMVQPGGPPRIWVAGRVTPGGRPADADTPFYIASMTKAYVGVLATDLDRRGVLPLDTRLDQVWPGLRIRGAPAAGQATLRELLGHRIPFSNDPLEYRTSYIDAPAVAGYRRLLEQGSEPRARTFGYTNLGWVLYAAALEVKTGRSWKAALTDDVLSPIGLTRTSPFASTFAPGEAAGGNRWLGAAEGWSPAPLKNDVLMNAGGGLVTSPADMARWLTAQLTLEGGALDPQSLRSAHVKISDLQEPAAGAPCSGYAFGWNLCTFAGRQVFLHGGSYTGVRSWMSFSDAFGTGIAVLSNSDSMTGWLGGALTGIFYASLADSDFSPPDAEAFRADYGSRVAKLVEARRQAATAARNSDRWKGWAWSPDAAALDAFAGTFTSADDAAGFLVSRDGSRLVARLGELEQAWIPAAPDLFATDSGPLDAPQPVKFERARGGRIVALTWQGRRFRRN